LFVIWKTQERGSHAPLWAAARRGGGGDFEFENSVGYTRDAKKVFVVMIMPAQYFINSWYLSYSKHIIGSALPYI